MKTNRESLRDPSYSINSPSYQKEVRTYIESIFENIKNRRRGLRMLIKSKVLLRNHITTTRPFFAFFFASSSRFLFSSTLDRVCIISGSS